MPAQTNVGVFRCLHITAFCLCTLLTLLAMVFYRTMNQHFNQDIDKCILFTRPWVELKDNKTCWIDLSKTEWGRDTLCNFVLFTFLGSFVYGIIAVWFFIMCSPSGRGKHDDRSSERFSGPALSIIDAWKIVPPSLVASALLLGLSLLTASLVSKGLSVFFGDINAGKLANCSAKITGPVIWDKDSNVELLSSWRKASEVMVWLLVAAWALGTGSLFVRCIMAADFPADEENQPLHDEGGSGATATTDVST